MNALGRVVVVAAVFAFLAFVSWINRPETWERLTRPLRAGKAARRRAAAMHPPVRERLSWRLALTEEEVFARFGEIVHAERKRQAREEQR